MADLDICATPVSGVGAEAPFLVENEAAMRKMMNDMAVKPTGDVDADFVAMMVPHHQGAIDMALAVLRHGRNPQIRRLAQEILPAAGNCRYAPASSTAAVDLRHGGATGAEDRAEIHQLPIQPAEP
jgi:hypothetical protein